jgi:hypothetical protein
MALPSGAAERNRAIIELRVFKMRNTQDAMTQRTNDFIGKVYLPALTRAGGSPVGVFGNLIGPDSPYTLTVAQFSTLDAWEAAAGKLDGEAHFVRMEVTLLRAFSSMPVIEVPKPLGDGRSRIFELRTYESNNPKTLARKIRMFDEGEIELFRKVGMVPVFFGETIAGQRMPNLAYMVGYEDLAAREKIWSTFVSHPEWKKMLAQPGVSDAEIVSNISNSVLRPMAFSAIK